MAAALRFGLRRFNGPWRRFTSTFAEGYQAEVDHAVHTTTTWRRISLFVAIPGVLLCSWNAWKKEEEHAQHISEHGREFIPYPHLRIRNKPFPWRDGNHSLFHNRHTNPLPDGFEEQGYKSGETNELSSQDLHSIADKQATCVVQVLQRACEPKFIWSCMYTVGH